MSVFDRYGNFVYLNDGSLSIAKLAVTPPVVGSVSTGTYKSPASE